MTGLIVFEREAKYTREYLILMTDKNSVDKYCIALYIENRFSCMIWYNINILVSVSLCMCYPDFYKMSASGRQTSLAWIPNLWPTIFTDIINLDRLGDVFRNYQIDFRDAGKVTLVTFIITLKTNQTVVGFNHYNNMKNVQYEHNTI